MSALSKPGNLPDRADEAIDERPVGLIPAAGAARRLGPLPCSKELLPIAIASRPEVGRDGTNRDETDGGGTGGEAHGRRAAGDPRVEVVAERLLAAFGRAGVERALMVIDRDKMDIPRYFAADAGRVVGADRPGATAGASGPTGRPERPAPPPALAFVPVAGSPSVPHTLAAALPFTAGSPVALGFPDILFTPADAFAHVERHRRESGAALVLGLFPAPDPSTTDMVEVDPAGRVLRIEVRPRRSVLTLNWLIAVWDGRFTAWLTARLARHEPARSGTVPHGGELQLGALFADALAEGLPVAGVPFPDGSYLDIGTPEGYVRALAEAGAFRPRPSR